MKKNSRDSRDSISCDMDLPIISVSAKLKHYGKIKYIRQNNLFY